LRVLDEFIGNKDLEAEVIPNDVYDFPSKFKPRHTILIKHGLKKMFVVAISTDAFYIDVLDGEAMNIVKELRLLLKKRGLTLVH